MRLPKIMLTSCSPTRGEAERSATLKCSAVSSLTLSRSGAAERSQDSLVGLWWVRILRKVGLIDEGLGEKLH